MLDWDDDEVEDEEAVPAAILFSGGTSVETAPASPVEKNSVVLFFIYFRCLLYQTQILTQSQLLCCCCTCKCHLYSDGCIGPSEPKRFSNKTQSFQFNIRAACCKRLSTEPLQSVFLHVVSAASVWSLLLIRTFTSCHVHTH